jgi:hypothetical protein
MDWATRYLIAVIVVAALTLATRDIGKVTLAGLLLASWLNENHWRNSLGFDQAWVPVAMTDIAFAALTTAIGLEFGVRRIAGVMVMLYAAREALQIVALAWLKHGYEFYAGLNIAYGLQLLALGGTALYGLATSGLSHRDWGLRPHGGDVLPAGPRTRLPTEAWAAEAMARLRRLVSARRGT